jgi:hypothetical protein
VLMPRLLYRAERPAHVPPDQRLGREPVRPARRPVSSSNYGESARATAACGPREECGLRGLGSPSRASHRAVRSERASQSRDHRQLTRRTCLAL